VSEAVVCGINWGDEGKGRVVDYLAGDFDLVVRYQGGNNAGHTVVNERGTFKLNLVPSGIFYPDVINVLGPGMVIDLEGLAQEIQSLESRSISCERLRLSDRATVVFPFHRQEDVWEEERLLKNAYGSTRRGIAPAYGDRYLKKAIQVGELLHEKSLRERLDQLIDWKDLVARQIYHQTEPLSAKATFDWAMKHLERLRPLICDTISLLETAQRNKKRILFEAQLGALRDVIYGIYPFTTSSATLASYAPIGSGLLSAHLTRVIGSMKAFSTCVGAGPFVTELFDERAARLRETAQEYGTATGRPRRIGEFDAVASRYGVQVQAATEIVLTKLDSLSGFGPLKICTHYEVDGRRIDTFPINPVLERAKPVYLEMPGWTEDLAQIREFDRLPRAAREYVLEIERRIGCPIRYVSVGPERQQMIVRG
jgi:adenylosuccinate synthase